MAWILRAGVEAFVEHILQLQQGQVEQELLQQIALHNMVLDLLD